jgi:hypothetical protein
LVLRPLGNTIYVIPPYCVTAADLNEIYAAINDAADALWRPESIAHTWAPVRTTKIAAIGSSLMIARPLDVLMR